MTHPPESTSQAALLKQAYLAVREMQAKLAAVGKPEPIAIVGMGCRLPGGVAGPAGFWDLLQSGTQTASVVPPDRWDIDRFFDPDPDAPGRMATPWGNFLDRIDTFDAAFFKIAPREAAGMDPQQRILLEVAWSALEDAAIDPETLRGTPAGVFLGLASSDYAHLQLISGDPELLNAHFASGSAASVASGRIAYLLGLNGPGLTLDTACSSSLVAIHLASQSLQSGESSLALAGGVNVIAAPETTIALSHARMLAPDGRSKVFDAAADGFSRGEGCGILVLKRLSDAQRDGDRIQAVLRGSAVNQDGASSSLTAPNGTAQVALMQHALRAAGVAARSISYVETHGTGTVLGDPIELRALGAVYGAGRTPETALTVASVKTNIGHLEAAAGVTGVIKAVLALQHATIPPHLNFQTPNPYVDWSTLNLRIPTALTPWPASAVSPRRAAVSAFGFSGTNAHLILEEAPPLAPAEPSGGPFLLPLSAETPHALTTLAGLFHAALSRPEVSPEDLCYTASVGRAHLAYRQAFVATTREALLAQLQTPFLPPERLEEAQPPRIGFFFATETSTGDAPHVQASTLYDLATRWRSWGIEPTIVSGHGIGEIVAASLAGIFPIQQVLAHLADPAGTPPPPAQAPRLPILSSSTGELLRTTEAFLADSPHLWTLHPSPATLRQPHRAAHCDLLLELASSTRLVHLTSSAPTATQTTHQILKSLYEAGCRIVWSAVHTVRARRIALPTYPFEKTRAWFHAQPPAPAIPTTTTHPLLGERQRSPNALQWLNTIGPSRLPWLDDHLVQGKRVVPGAAYLEMALNAIASLPGQSLPALQRIRFHTPCFFDQDRSLHLTLHTADGVPSTFEIHSAPFDALPGDAQWTLHASGHIAPAPSAPEPKPAPLPPATHVLSGPALYQLFQQHGVQFGPAFRPITSARATGTLAEVHIHLDPLVQHAASRYRIHPIALDACFQAIGALAPNDGPEATGPYLPGSIESLALFGDPTRLTHARATVHQRTPERWLAEIHGLDVNGNVLLHARNMAFFPATPQPTLSTEVAPWLFRTEWVERPSPPSVTASSAKAALALIPTGQLSDGTGLLSPSGNIRTIPFDPSNPEEALRLHFRALLAPTSAPPDLLLFPAHPDSTEDFPTLTRTVLRPALLLVQECLAHPAPPRLWLVTVGAQGDTPANPHQAALAGLARTVAAESPSLFCCALDLDPAQPTTPAELLDILRTLPATDRPTALMLRAGRILEPRLARLTIPSPSSPNLQNHSVRTETPAYTLESLRWSPSPRPAPAVGEVEIEVQAAGMNFREVLVVLGLYRGALAPLGGECSGTITRVGPGVPHFAVGDAVLAIAPGSFATFVLAPAALVWPMPRRLSFSSAATIPLAFLTAQFSLFNVGHLQPGQSVLIHAGAGAVGLATVQLALRAGAIVYATAGSPGKRRFLESVGVAAAMDSRSPAFAARIAELTRGCGVDLVVNSLTGPALEAGLASLTPGGAFIELGIAEILSPERLQALRPDIHYQPLNLAADLAAHSPELRDLLTGLLDRFQAGDLQPLPWTAFPLDEPEKAFRFMAQARQIGKVLLRPAPSAPTTLIRPESAYLVTGGLRGLGLLVAEWLARHGATRIILLGRSAPSPEVLATLDRIRQLGAEVLPLALDVTDPADCASALLAAGDLPLRGIFHSAGVLEQALLPDQTSGSFDAVLAPKLAGAWHLHQLTRHAPLDHFVLFSSIAALTGSPGQASHAAANAALDAFAHHRRNLGLPATSINWGPWSGTGAAVRHNVLATLEGLGIHAIAPPQGLHLLELALQHAQAPGWTQPVVLPIDLHGDRLTRNLARLPELARLLAPLLPSAPTSPAAAAPVTPISAASTLLQSLAAAPSANRRFLLLQFLETTTRAILSLPESSAVDPRRPFHELGLDSLLSVEMRTTLSAALHRKLPTTLLFDYPTPDALATFLLAELYPEPAPSAKTDPSAPRNLVRDIENLTDEEVDRLFADKP